MNKMSLWIAGLCAITLTGCEFIPTDLQNLARNALPPIAGASTQTSNGISFELTSCTLTDGRTFICRMSVQSSYRDRVLNLAAYGSGVEIQDDTGTPYPAKVTFGTDPNGSRRKSTLIADSPYEITMMAENVSTRATKVRSVIIARWRSDLTVRGGAGETNLTFSSPTMVAESHASVANNVAPQSTTPRASGSSSLKEKFGVSFELLSCGLTGDHGILCRMKVSSAFQNRIVALNSYGANVEIQDDTGTPYPARATFGTDPRGTRYRNTLIADTSYDLTIYAENISTRAASVRSVEISRWRASLATGGGGGELGFIYTQPRMVETETADETPTRPATNGSSGSAAPPTRTSSNPDRSTASGVERAAPQAAAPSEKTSTPSALEFSTNRFGGDFHNLEITTGDPRDCEKACRANDLCKSWSYVQPGIQGPNARCWLKSIVPPPAPNNCCVSGVVR